ncbi:MAG: arginyl-tRNA synthetase [Patescibacteria group bacterium]|nr:arginyl-tRNA synthetase [Patescibacteria group bacterium]
MTIQEIIGAVEDAVRESVKKAYGVQLEAVGLDFPPDVSLGDFAVNFFSLAKEIGKSPAEIAKTVVEGIVAGEFVESAVAAGPYLNLKINRKTLFNAVCCEILEKGEKFGGSPIGQKKRVMVEYLSPNTNKPIHLGHIRNGSLGMAMSNILEASGYEVVKAILVNDRGVHICKSMLAYSRWGNGETPESTGIKGDHFVGKWYVRYSLEAEKNPLLKVEVQEMLQKWEAGDKETMDLWKKMNDWAYQGFNETYEKYGFEFDKYYFESETYKLGKNIVEEGLKKKAFRKDKNGAVVFDLPEEEFGRDEKGQARKMAALRADGTSVYLTQDLGTAVSRAEDYSLSRLIYVVGNEQVFHFKVLFKILSVLGYSWAKDLYHLSFAMVYLPDGKMKSREGKVVDADNLLEEVQNFAAEEIRKRDTESLIPENEIVERARKVALGAIKFYLLRVKPSQDIHFDPKESLSFEGFTGPYCQYAYARIAGILRNAEKEKTDFSQADFSLLGNSEERLLLQKLAQFPAELEKAAGEYNPLRVLTQTYEVAKAFSQFYNAHPVLQAEDKKLITARLELIKAAAVVIKKGLSLLGIEVMERM